MKSAIKNNQFQKKTLSSILTALFVLMILGSFQTVSAQFTFMGDYDRTFAAPLGYYIDPQNPTAPATDTSQAPFYTGEYAPDGSIIAGGRHVDNASRGDFYLRKFTASGAVDTSFGTGGFVRTNFHLRSDGVGGSDTPQVLKVQPDGKIVFAGQCVVFGPDFFQFGTDACVVRYNANGTLDSSFGGLPIPVSNGPQIQMVPIDPGKAIFQTGIRNDFGETGGTFFDMAIQLDGKIVLVGETRTFTNSPTTTGWGTMIVRLNPNGTLDTSFGGGGIVRRNAPAAPAGCNLARTLLSAVRLQPDGRIIAVGYDDVAIPNNCSNGTRFVVTRWTANGQLETVRHITDLSSLDGFFTERAVSVHLSRDGSKVLVSGSARNYSGVPAGRQKPTMARFNIGDLSLDTTFGNGGIVQYNRTSNNWQTSTLYVKAIQPDGRIIATDDVMNHVGNVVRFNPDGSSDQSFGNVSILDGSTGGRGRLRALVTNYNGQVAPIEAGQILVRPNGRINLIGYSTAHAGLGILRAAVSQQYTTFQNGVYGDFENDGKDNISVFRDGNWYWLNSTNNSFNAAQFGIASDKLAPADYDGDGRTDLAVFRDGAWYIIQSSNGAFRALNFGAAGDLPRPGDFDGDGLADISVFRPSDGTWYRINSGNNQFVGIQFGANGDVPVLADFDADGRTDISVFRSGVWYWLRSADGQFAAAQFGISGDIPVIGDYDGDSRADLAVFRPSNGTWYWNGTQAGFNAAQFGANGDKPVPGDYDNDGKNDLAVYRNGAWYIINSGNNSFTGINFGLANDKPIEAAYTQP
ncbi:MAG TPA: FG-GAP-like repeat-containing protein [Pyrinomonadaceae bacterium]